MRPGAYRGYLLSLLLVIFAFNLMDRYALGVVLQDIKVDLDLTDTQLGFLSGIAFALFYSIMGIPIGRWADRGNRATIISLTTAVWSVAVAVCGMAGNFVQLLLVRIGVGVGEAGCIPPAHSLIADYFTRAERPRAVGIYYQGMNVSLVLGYFLAGWLNEFYGWRAMFVWLGLPGVGLAVLAWFTVREPRCEKPTTAIASSSSAALTPTQPSMTEVVLTLWANATFRHLLYGLSVMYFFGYGMLQWQPAFFVRSFELSTGELGTWFAVVYGVCGIVGTYWGGQWASRRAADDERLQLKAMAVVNVVFNGAIWALIYVAPNYYVAFALMGLGSLGCAALYPPLFATIQTLVPPRMRAMSIAIIYLFANLIGMGLGPLAVGMVSDALQPTFGQESLRYALLITCPGYVWVSWHLWRASQTVARDIAAMPLPVDHEDVAGATTNHGDAHRHASAMPHRSER